MVANVSVLYPQGAKFDLNYYIKSHMPMVLKNWSSLGLKGYRVIELSDEKAPYKIHCLLEFDDMSAFQKAVGDSSAKEVMDDIPNFCDQQPTFLSGDVVGTS